MELQRSWTHKNTLEMQERGEIIRNGIPLWLRNHESRLRAGIGRTGVNFKVEGRDGTGRKTEIPWVRFYSEAHSPSATEGWYCVYLFDAKGTGFYLALAHGSTRFVDGEFKPRSEDEVRGLVAWAHELLDGRFTSDPRIVKNISLQGTTKMGPAYERSTVAAIHYSIAALPTNEQLIADAAAFSTFLGRLYDAQDLGQSPEAVSPEVAAALVAVIAVAQPLKASQAGGQGFGLSAEERRTVELHAMSVATAHLVKLGFQTKDVSDRESYDILATGSDKQDIYVEVKGTTSGLGQVVLTTAEVALNRRHYPNTALIVVYGIELERTAKPIRASAGTLKLFSPWLVDDCALTPMSYRYVVPNA